MPVWIQVGIVAFCFLFFGTNEETYLAIYAAGVFVLLSMTGWAVAKRLIRNVRQKYNFGTLALIVGTIVAAILTTGATGIIFVERFMEGAWTYFLFIPILYAVFTYSRDQLGAPSPALDYLGRLDASLLAGFGFGQMNPATGGAAGEAKKPEDLRWEPAPIQQSKWRNEEVAFNNIVVLLDGSPYAAQALPWAKLFCLNTGAHLTLLSAIKSQLPDLNYEFATIFAKRKDYLESVKKELGDEGIQVDFTIRTGFIADAAQLLVHEQNVDLVVTATRGKSGVKNWSSGGLSRKLIQKINQPILLVQVSENGQGAEPKLDRILVPLDGSIFSERVLPYARALAQTFVSELILLTIPAVPEPEDYHAPAEVINTIRRNAETEITDFLDAVARSLRKDDLSVRTIVAGSLPARTIVNTAKEEDVDLIMSTSRGRGGIELFFLGSEAQRIVENSEKTILMMPIRDRPL
jgi:nucleotide-binding universal stress UspA family protein